MSDGTRCRTLRIAALAAPVLISGPLLRRMRTELLDSGRLSRATATDMYALYGTHALSVAATAARRAGPMPASLTVAGPPLLVTGTAMTVAGMRRFAGPGQITGTDVAGLVDGGAYRLSRNPQYTGYVLALTGLALWRRSAACLALTAALATVYLWWVPVEETALRRSFGQPYDDYLRAAPRWLGMPSSR